jgi:superfamily I DNA/RNA helicase
MRNLSASHRELLAAAEARHERVSRDTGGHGVEALWLDESQLYDPCAGPDALYINGAPGVRLATMHRAKGLQFDHVVLPDLDAGRFPDPHVLAQVAAGVERRYVDRCRSLLFWR